MLPFLFTENQKIKFNPTGILFFNERVGLLSRLNPPHTVTEFLDGFDHPLDRQAFFSDNFHLSLFHIGFGGYDPLKRTQLFIHQINAKLAGHLFNGKFDLSFRRLRINNRFGLRRFRCLKRRQKQERQQ